MKIKTGDKVKIIHGKEKGKEGVVLQIFPKQERIVVEGMHMMTRHIKRRNKEQPGQAIKFPSPFAISNVQLISSKTGKYGRVGFKTILSQEGEKKKKIRILRLKGTKEDIE
jgi:large subunit ribosomal protein L24